MPTTLAEAIARYGKPDSTLNVSGATPPAMVAIYEGEKVACSFWKSPDTSGGFVLKGCLDTERERPITNSQAARRLERRARRAKAPQ